MDSFRGGLLAPMLDLETESHSNPELAFFVNYISTLEGVKTKIKNLHWAARNLSNRDKRGAHIYLDDFLGIVSSFQDTIAESSQGIIGVMGMNEVSGTSFSVSSPKELISYVRDRTINFYNSLPSSTIYVGIKSETETFIKDITKYNYLFQLTE